ncbi:MAG: recombinase family protein [Christensenellaceae bacterium]|jgi:DNA invertase Pin-like site-specific DNA recombinase|nr:recombinase family protein [Christensenellaceae bacterium]
MKAVCYYRYSSSQQTEQSIEGQQKVCQDYAARNDLEIINEYIDRAQTGTNDKRPAFQKMIADASNEEFQAILVYKFDRFARNRYDSVLYKKLLKDIGISVISCMENVSNDEGGQTVEAIYEVMAEWYSIDLSKKSIRGKVINAQKGLHNGEKLPIGYMTQDKRVVVDPARGPFIEMMFSRYANGVSAEEILEELKLLGVTNTDNRPILKGSLYSILKNSKYCYPYDFHGIQVQLPPLVDSILYEDVKSLLQTRYNAPGRNTGEYLLSGKLYCGYCKKRMRGKKTIVTKDKAYYYYECFKGVSQSHDCIKTLEKRGNIDNYVIDKITALITNDRVKVANEIFEARSDHASKCKFYDDKIKKKQAEVNLGLDNALKAVGKLSPDLVERMYEIVEEWKVDLKKLEDEYNELKKANKPYTREEILTWFDSFKNCNKQELVDKLIHSVYAYNDRIVINFKGFKDPSKIYDFAIMSAKYSTDYTSHGKLKDYRLTFKSTYLNNVTSFAA